MNICDRELCSGCHACYSKCPKNAIKMVEDSEGFLRPQIDENLCVSCDLCKKVCPANNSGNLKTPAEVYAGWDKNDVDKFKSASGGIATLLSKKFLENGDYVCGAVFDKGLTIRHKIISKLEELDMLRGSKYVQSTIGDCVKQIKELLDNGKKVLFIGTPCQVSGLKNFIGKNDDNLYTIDLICHGTPSQMAFRKYIDEINKKYNSDIDFCEFRANSSYIMKLQEKNKTVYSNEYLKDIYGTAFLKSLNNRPSCYKCSYAQKTRIGDLTLGDFWGIDKEFIKKYKIKNGLSVLLVNTDKGKCLVDYIGNDANLHKRTLDEAVNGNDQLRAPAPKHKNRDKFYLKLQKYSFSKAAAKCLRKELLKNNILILLYKYKILK